ncbi:hypothetical protein C7999DRAFT_28355 [Corynascus novoguineensis]|uniref:Uncharacterized protein n=1 Tax=Corynascus novoguineensis TaxID=1126955 RepID=A0AAN7CZ28_9PEZI|nr:hypothetical protein C7999DRAFT_28355 [Corynascus novoguineensis]
MRLRCEFFQVKLNRTDGPDFFKPGRLLPDRLTLHRFLFWVADNSVGNLYTSSHEPSTMTENTTVQVRTVVRHVRALACAFDYFNRPLDKELVREATLWVQNNLAQELDLNREVKQKPIAYYSDVAEIIEAIWVFDSLAVCRNIMNRFNTTLILNFLVDGASRIGEFIPVSSDAARDGRFMTWVDVEFWVLPSDGLEPVTIHAVILCKWLKNHTFDPTGHKSFVVSLLPPHLVFQDSCRLLVILALYRGYIND